MSTAPLEFNIIQATTPEQFAECMAVRMKVFVEEQKYDASVEQDDDDPICVHFLLYETSTGSNIPVGNVRLLEKKNKLGRLAVLPDYRKHKLGARLVNHLRDYAVEQARAKGAKEAVVMCHSQAYVVPFYAKLGYESVGPRFDEEGTEHQKMVLTISL